MISSQSMRLIFATAMLAVFLDVACGSRPTGSSEAESTNAPPAVIQKEKEPPAVSLPAPPTRFAERKVKPATIPSPDPLPDETPRNHAFDKIDWGRESSLDEIIAMAKRDEIQLIEWHVMPNILRAQARDDRVFHIRNESKGIDMRSALISAGIPIGKDGVIFRHVF
jgi:hypothetical protein